MTGPGPFNAIGPTEGRHHHIDDLPTASRKVDLRRMRVVLGG